MLHISYTGRREALQQPVSIDGAEVHRGEHRRTFINLRFEMGSNREPSALRASTTVLPKQGTDNDRQQAQQHLAHVLAPVPVGVGERPSLCAVPRAATCSTGETRPGRPVARAPGSRDSAVASPMQKPEPIEVVVGYPRNRTATSHGDRHSSSTTGGTSSPGDRRPDSMYASR